MTTGPANIDQQFSEQDHLFMARAIELAKKDTLPFRLTQEWAAYW